MAASSDSQHLTSLVPELSEHTTFLSTSGTAVHKQVTASCTEYATAVEEQIEQSKRHWSLLSTSSSSSIPDDAAIDLDNRAVFDELMEHPRWGGFFGIFGYDTEKWMSAGSLEVGEKFAEGGQAELFHVQVTWSIPEMNEWDVEGGLQWVLKVFKKGTMLRHLQSQWPEGYLQSWAEDKEHVELGKELGYRWHCEVMYGTLLEDGRFAFLMVKEDEDLRSVIDRNIMEVEHGCGPFPKEEEEDIMYRVARGMEWLHNMNIVHRDLKASNVLVRKFYDGSYGCLVADFECSIGVVGIGFFRAPEILQACKERNVNERQELFSRVVDVCSYGMICYEILTGKLPFEDHLLNDNKSLLIDLVINHDLHPEVPHFVDGWKFKLLQSCWESDAMRRPSFREILSLFEASSSSEYISEQKTRRIEGC